MILVNLQNFFLLLSILLSTSALSSDKFEKWKLGYIKRASKRGISSSLLKKHLKDVKFDKAILLKDKKQITSNKQVDYNKWIKVWLRSDNSRIKTAKLMLKKHKYILEKIEKKYNVDKEVIIALWGVETFFGKITGSYDLISSLSTLAYKSRRKTFFEIQLSAAFRLIQKGHVTREDLKGSWAGATGQMQFMPSNFNIYAKDFDLDNKKDIWNNYGDIFASIAFYLKKAGWKRGKVIGELLVGPGKMHKSLIAELPFKNSPVVLKGPNFDCLMKWNKSSLFAALNIIIINNL